MAEAIALSQTNRYFCYACDREVTLSPSAQLTCPDCSSGFIEEVTDDHDDVDYDDESDVDESELNLLNLLSLENLFRRTLSSTVLSAVGDEHESPRHTSSESNDESDSLDSRPGIEVLSARNIIEVIENTFNRDHRSGLRQVGDYLFGDDIDAISTMLLNDSEVVGPPPLPKDQMKLLPNISVTKEDVDKEVQCTICMEDFVIREKAKLLPCQHFYHEKCIVPWLERHATCPNCRKPVEVQSKTRRSQSCPRTDYNLRSSDERRSSESMSASRFFTNSINPFRFI